jgi:hypothetical protein
VIERSEQGTGGSSDGAPAEEGEMDQYGRTDRLELADQTLREWNALVLDASADGIVLDRSAFYLAAADNRRITESCSKAAYRPHRGGTQGRRSH